jgi:hypothetical protein
LPALVLALALCVIVWWRYRDDDLSGVTRHPGATRAHLLIALPGLALPFLIRAAVVEGRRDRDGSLHHRHRLHGHHVPDHDARVSRCRG